MTYFHVSPASGNKKTGSIVTTTTSVDSCPDTCKLKGAGCYADTGPLALHWRKVSAGGRGTDSLQDHADTIKGALLRMPKGSRLVRLNQAGDIPAHSDAYLYTLSQAIKYAGGKGWTYTHRKDTDTLQAIRNVNQQGSLVVNLSCDSPSEALQAHKAGFPSVMVIAADAPKVTRMHGVRVIACPADKDKVTCANCDLCRRVNRSFIVGFRAHGAQRLKAEKSSGIVRLSDLPKKTRKGSKGTASV